MGLIVAAVLFILAMIGLARPYIGLLALVIVMELQPGELYPYLAPLHLERIIAGMLLAGFIIHGAKWRFPAPTRWFLAFYGAMVLSIPLAFWRGNAAGSCFQFLEIVVYVLFATALLTTEARIRWFILTDVLLVDWLGGSALWNYAHGIWQVRMHIERAIGITSSAGDPNTMAATLLFSIPLSIALTTRTNPVWMRLVGLGSIALALVTIVDTGSRGAAAGVVFLIVLLLARRPKNLIYLPILLLLGPVVWLAIPQQYKARYETVDNLKNDASYQNRIRSWEGGIAMFESNPLTGVGAGNYTDANGVKFWPSDTHKVYLDAHSLYFKLIGELGLLGVITFGGYLICVFRLNLRLRRELADRDVSKFLKVLPGTFNIMLLQLLFAGYASHDLYRSMWFVVGAMSASIAFLPVLQRVPAAEIAPPGAIEPPGDEGEWSPALLPALRTRVPLENPPA
ncbi:MAG: O-antigen ligase family protein [Acidobacteriaceae bacterium]